MSPREFHRIKSQPWNHCVADPHVHGELTLLCTRAIQRFNRFHDTKVVMVRLDEAGSSAGAAPFHPECADKVGGVECREAWALQRAALERHPAPVWHHCPHNRLCGLVPVVQNERCVGALKLVRREGGSSDAFAREVELLQVLTEHALLAGVQPQIHETMPANGSMDAPTPAIQHPLIERAHEFIEEHLSDPELSVAGVAAAVGSHPDYLAHLFAQHTGERMSHYIAVQRTALAKRLLATTTWQIKRVAWACGYANPNWFSHVFREHVGVAPLDFRRSARRQA